MTTAQRLSRRETDIGETTVLQILRIADLLTKIGDTKVFRKELTQAQFNILMILKRHGQDGMSQKEIMAYLVSTKGNVSIHIGNLTRSGYIRKRVSKLDSRMNKITLTSKGVRVLEKLEPEYIRQLRELTDNLPRKQAESAIALLGELMGRCEKTLGDSESWKGVIL